MIIPKFIFKGDNRANWDRIFQNLRAWIERTGFDIEITPKKYNKNRSSNQLRAYWVLINVVKNWMNSQGNSYTEDNVSDYFKWKSGYCIEIEGEMVVKSIANQSNCSVEEMEKLITTILEFGIKNGIDGCEIDDLELKSILNYYQPKSGENNAGSSL